MTAEQLISQQLLDCLQRHDASVAGAGLWVCDENLAGLQLPAPVSELAVLTNRYDVYLQLSALGWTVYFSDFDFSRWQQPAALERIYYRVSKEKAVVHHVINESLKSLRAGGELVLLGAKNEGTKTYFEKAAELSAAAHLNKLGKSTFMGILQAGSDTPPAEAWLDDRQYTSMKPISGLVINHQPVQSKPGIFGWDKIDAGSELLVEQLPTVYSQLLVTKPRVLDLGCGYGYLSVHAWQQGARHITATDNNAAAVHCCRHNFEQLGIDGDVVADDCAGQLAGPYDLIICNPPFHQGFAVEGELTDRFLASAARLLDSKGQAVFVVNAFIPLERKAKGLFAVIDTFFENGSFKLVRLAGSLMR